MDTFAVNAFVRNAAFGRNPAVVLCGIRVALGTVIIFKRLSYDDKQTSCSCRHDDRLRRMVMRRETVDDWRPHTRPRADVRVDSERGFRGHRQRGPYGLYAVSQQHRTHPL